VFGVESFSQVQALLTGEILNQVIELWFLPLMAVSSYSSSYTDCLNLVEDDFVVLNKTTDH